MRKGPHRRFGLLGALAVGLGLLIILSMLLPSGFWWFLLGLGLICLGIYFIRSC